MVAESLVSMLPTPRSVQFPGDPHTHTLFPGWSSVRVKQVGNRQGYRLQPSLTPMRSTGSTGAPPHLTCLRCSKAPSGAGACPAPYVSTPLHLGRCKSSFKLLRRPSRSNERWSDVVQQSLHAKEKKKVENNPVLYLFPYFSLVSCSSMSYMPFKFLPIPNCFFPSLTQILTRRLYLVKLSPQPPIPIPLFSHTIP